jgi:hypothetical protein
MNEKVLASLIQILQKHANCIRTLQALNIALAESLRLSEERAGVPYEEFESRLQETFEVAIAESPTHDPQGIAREIEETVEKLVELENLLKKPLN